MNRACENVVKDEQNNRNTKPALLPGQLPISVGFPLYSSINKRRRVTCKNCKTPVGYINLDLLETEACKSEKMRSLLGKIDDRLIGALCIKDPINVHICPRKNSGVKIKDQYLPLGTHVIETINGDHHEAEEVRCEFCCKCLGVRVTEYSSRPSLHFLESKETLDSNELDESKLKCGPAPIRDVFDRWFAFSYDEVEIEPLFGLIGLNQLSVNYYGGEKYFSEIEKIEDSEKYCNDSQTWMYPMSRRPHQVEVPKKTKNNAWPLVPMDFVRITDLPSGIIGQESVIENASNDASSAFSRNNNPRQIIDDSSDENDC